MLLFRQNSSRRAKIRWDPGGMVFCWCLSATPLALRHPPGEHTLFKCLLVTMSIVSSVVKSCHHNVWFISRHQECRQKKWQKLYEMKFEPVENWASEGNVTTPCSYIYKEQYEKGKGRGCWVLLEYKRIGLGALYTLKIGSPKWWKGTKRRRRVEERRRFARYQLTTLMRGWVPILLSIMSEDQK